MMQAQKERELFIEKPLPSNMDAEKIILGAILTDNSLIAQAAETLLSEDFYHARYKAVYAAMLELFAENQTIDPITVIERMKFNGLTESVVELSKYQIGLPYFKDIYQYVEVVKEKSVGRQLIKTCNEICSITVSESEPLAAVIDRAEQSIYNLRQTGKADAPTGISDLVFESFAEISERAKNGIQTLGLKTGFKDIDALTSGLQQTDLIIIAARPSMGKSSLALDIVKGATSADPATVCAVFSLEMSKRQCADRLLCSIAEVDSNNYRMGNLNRDQWGRVAAAADKLQQSRIVIDDKAAISPLELKAKARRIAAQHKRLDLIVVDYLQLMSGTKKTESRQQEVSEISRELKGLAKDLKVPVIALSQLSRACEARTDKRPLMSDLRESGSLEQDADIVAFIYRDEYYNPTEENAGVAELIFRKHRHGRTDTVRLAFIGQYAKFGDYYNY